MIVITATIHTDKETLPDLYARLKEMVPLSRAEEGNVFYHMAMEDEENCSIVAMEGWVSQTALEEHLALPHVVKLLSDFDGKYSNDVSIHQVSSTQKL